MSNKNLPLDFSSLEEKLGHTFADKELLRLALTHSSYANEQRAKGQPIKCNERLEFLGDSVLSVIVSDYIYRNYPDLPEGELTKIRAGSVCERALGVYANDIHLGDYLYMGKGEETTNGRTRVSILSDAFEATLAALYLDAGIEAVRPFLLPYVTEEIRRILRSGHTEDFKTMLQQIVLYGGGASQQQRHRPGRGSYQARGGAERRPQRHPALRRGNARYEAEGIGLSLNLYTIGGTSACV